MSAAFTDPAPGGCDFLDVAVANEIRTAYQERIYYAMEWDLDIGVWSAGDSATVKTWWKTFQQGLEYAIKNFDYWVDDDNSTYDPVGDSIGITMHTLATWRASAGLHDDGNDLADGTSFRRVWAWNANEYATIPWADGPVDTEDLAWDYGYIQDGDIFGYWIYQDLQNGLSALRWTRRNAYFYTNSTTRAGKGTDEADWATAIANAKSNYPGSAALGYLVVGTYGQYVAGRAGDDYQTWVEGDTGYCRVTGMTTDVDCSVQFYGIARAAHLPMTSNYVFDDNGNGWSQDVYNDLGQSPLQSAETHDSTTLVGDDLSGGWPTWCSDPTVSGDSARGYEFLFQATDEIVAICKWDFTNA